MLEIYCDGGCKVGKEVGAASYLFVKDSKFQFIHSTKIMRDGLTNNQAEYLAMMLALTDCPFEEVTIYSDSEIVVKQLNGQYEVKDEKLKALNCRVKKIIKIISQPVHIKNVPRENKYIMLCDKMNKLTMELM